MGEDPIIETILVRAAFQQLADLPVDALDGDARVGTDLPLPVERRIRGTGDDGGVGDGCDGTIPRLEVAREQLVERLPPPRAAPGNHPYYNSGSP